VSLADSNTCSCPVLPARVGGRFIVNWTCVYSKDLAEVFSAFCARNEHSEPNLTRWRLAVHFVRVLKLSAHIVIIQCGVDWLHQVVCVWFRGDIGRTRTALHLKLAVAYLFIANKTGQYAKYSKEPSK
jgi:hypothetical protein